jgi:hypothetical protein
MLGAMEGLEHGLGKVGEGAGGAKLAVTVEIVIGKNGHVASVHAVSGPPEARKGCEDAVRKWTYPPFLVLDKSVEVEQKVECRSF